MVQIDWHLVVCGISHSNSTLEQREPLQFGHDEMARANATFNSIPGVLENLIVSTCNRIEFYFVSERSYDPFDQVVSFFKEVKNIDIGDMRDKFYIRKGKHVAGHLFRVASGIDSMVIGENQILGQLKDAYSSSCAVKASGKLVHRLFHQAFRVGKQVRSDTPMGRGACSVSSVAVDMLTSKLDKFEEPSILFVGINRMTELAAKNLSHFDKSHYLFSNRTVEKAEIMAEKYKGEGHALDVLPQLLPRADVVISCTGSKKPVITRTMVDDYLKENPGRKIFIMDMAVPRDVELEKDYNPAVELYDLEDIGRFVREGQRKREDAIPEAEHIIERLLGEFTYWYEHVRHEPVYNGLEQSFEDIRREEVADLVDKLPPDLKSECEAISRRMVKRLLQVKIRSNVNHKKTG